MYQLQKRKKSCCPNGHMLQEQLTKAKLNSFLSHFGNVDYIKIHVPSSLKCNRCDCTIYADHQPTFATCEACNFHLCRSCASDSSSPVSAASYDAVSCGSRKRKGSDRNEQGDQMAMDFDCEDPNVANVTNRYNNVRPNYAAFPRVQYEWYPEPSHYGWRFTGSCETRRVEFYEREVENGTVLLDVDFMVGTVRTVFNHRVDGQIVLFGKGKSLLPDVYQKVLLNPLFSDRGFRRRW